MFSELDIDVLPSPFRKNTAEVSAFSAYQDSMNPYPNKLPKEVAQAQAERYEAIFKLLKKHHQTIQRVTFWGITDEDSWKNNHPIKGRTNYPLLFDRKNNPKEAFHLVIEEGKKNQ